MTCPSDQQTYWNHAHAVSAPPRTARVVKIKSHVVNFVIAINLNVKIQKIQKTRPRHWKNLNNKSKKSSIRRASALANECLL